MPVYHIVLFHTKPGVTEDQISEWSQMVKSGLGQVPGLVSIEANKPLPISASRTKGYDMAVVAVLEGAEHIAGYAAKAAQQAQSFREQLFDDTIAFDLEY